MQVFNTFKQIKHKSLTKVVLLCGNFDGLHRGHQALIKQAKIKAEASSSKLVLLSFNPHPRTLLYNEEITNILDEALYHKYLDKYGIDYYLCIPFNKVIAQLNKEQFIQAFLLDFPSSIEAIYVGKNWRFARNREGDVAFLQESLSCEVIGMDELQYQQTKVSSSNIRQFIAEYKFSKVIDLLGRPFQIYGKIIKGYGIAKKTLLVPTANLEVKNKLAIRGVFAVKCLVREQEYLGVCNIGTSPTMIDNKEIRVEVHLFDFQGDLYDEFIQISFYKKIRDEQKFISSDELTKKILQDILQVKTFFKSENS